MVQHLVEHLDIAVILIGTTNSMSRELLPNAQAVEEPDRTANEIAGPALNGTNAMRENPARRLDVEEPWSISPGSMKYNGPVAVGVATW